MNAQNLQSLIALNAARITVLTAQHGDHIAQAKDDKLDGEISLMHDEYSKADKVRRKLGKAVEMQRTLKAELNGVHTAARIERKKARAIAAGAILDGDAMRAMTSGELEAGLDHLLSLLFPAKADSRKKVA